MNKFDTDKYTHGYIPIYEPFFNEKKDSKDILEIGIFTGGSLRLWAKKFKNAQVYGIDVADCSEVDSDRIKTFIADQSNRDQLKSVMEKINAEIDVIIDDGGHTMKQQQTSFGFLFKYLKSGGVYIIEDLHTSNMLDRDYVTKNDSITSLDMLEKFKESGIITSNHISQEEIDYLNNNIKNVEIWTRTPDKAQSVTSAIFKK